MGVLSSPNTVSRDRKTASAPEYQRAPIHVWLEVGSV